MIDTPKTTPTPRYLGRQPGFKLDGGVPGCQHRAADSGGEPKKTAPAQTRRETRFSSKFDQRLDLALKQEGDNECVDRQGFDEGQAQNHRGLQPVGRIGIATDRFHCGSHASALPEGSTDRGSTDGDTSSHRNPAGSTTVPALGGQDRYDWPSAATPWLVLDRDGNGFIEDGSELFGSGTRLASGRRALNGFEALRELDSNGDGVISSTDDAWSELKAWSDADGDRVGADLELQGLAEFGLQRIELDYRVDRVCDARGNCEVERAAFVFVDASGRERQGEVVDVHLAAQ